MSRLMKHCCSAAISLSGFALIVAYGGWMLAIGFFIALWGNNIQGAIREGKL